MIRLSLKIRPKWLRCRAFFGLVGRPYLSRFAVSWQMITDGAPHSLRSPPSRHPEPPTVLSNWEIFTTLRETKSRAIAHYYNSSRSRISSNVVCWEIFTLAARATTGKSRLLPVLFQLNPLKELYLLTANIHFVNTRSEAVQPNFSRHKVHTGSHCTLLIFRAIANKPVF